MMIREFFYGWHQALTKSLEGKMVVSDYSSLTEGLMDEFEFQSDGGAFDSQSTDCLGFAENELPKMIKTVIDQVKSPWTKEQQDLVAMLVERGLHDRVLEARQEKAFQDLPEKLAERAMIFEDPRAKSGGESRS